jgi:predicted ATPase/class 3 adenylate cyclase
MMPSLPSGTVTFLFTDIEGSTQLWERQPEAMRAELERHNALIQEAIDSNGGMVFKTAGDAFCAAFASAADGLRAALAAQRALTTETWAEEVGALRVRMGLHTGHAQAQEGDYFGPPVNRTARIESAGHGGQVLLSLATQELVRDDLPDGVSLIELGQHRLKDVLRPETIFQLSAPGLPSEFPALATLDTQRTNIPLQATPFVGRGRELAALTDLLRRDDVRLVTLTGPGGIGKTRLSLQVTAGLLDAFEHGAFFVELAPITDSDLVTTTIASTLGMSESGDEPLLENLMRYLHKKQMLLVIDNFEHVIDAAPVVGELLAGAPNLKIMTTSRELLRVYGEHDYPVPPLGLPEESRQQTVGVVSQSEAVSLFVQRAKAAQAGFQITEENALVLAEICTRLEGLPLAIELAAARVRLFEPEALLARLSDSLKTLTGGARNLPHRQQTIRNTLEWSYDLLDSDEQALFERLGVFQGGRSIEATEAVCGPDLAIDVWDGLESLLNKSLLRREKGPQGEARFVMLETIHAYASERLEDSHEADELRKRHAAYFVTMAERASTKLTGHEQSVWMNRLTQDYDNLRKAMDWTLGGGDLQAGLRLVVALGPYWKYKSRWQEGQRWLQLALDSADQAPASVQGQLYTLAGFMAWALHDSEESKRLHEKALVIERKLENHSEVARVLIQLGLVSGDLSEIRLETSQEGLALAREIGDKDGIALGLNVLGEIYRIQGDYPAAKQVYEECLPITREIGDQLREVMIISDLGLVAFNLDDFEQARARGIEAYKLALEIGDDWFTADGLSFSGGYLAGLGHPERAARLIGAGEAQLAAIGSRRQPGDQFELDKLIALVRSQLDDETFHRLYAEGESMSLEEASKLMLRED